MSENKQIAQTIFQQIGGNRFVVMTGAKNFSTLDKGLAFTIPNRKVNVVQIRLQPDDTYTVLYLKVTGVNFKVVANEGGIYCDQLQESFTRNTGMFTNL